MFAFNFADGDAAIATLATDIARAWTIAGANGAGAGAPARTWSTARTVAGGGSDTVDLAGGDASLTCLKGLLLYAYPANPGVVDVVIGATPLQLQPGELVAKLTPATAGYPVGPADLVKLTNAAPGDAQLGILVIGS